MMVFSFLVPIYDCRSPEHRIDAKFWDDMWGLPVWSKADIPDGSLVTVGFTTNTFPTKSSAPTGTSKPADHLSLNLQFVIVHTNPIE
jgi:hypothetical protein